jgi:hypothetical protein
LDWPATNFGNRVADLSDFESGGIPRDAVPAVDQPLFARVDRLHPAPSDKEPVVSVSVNGDARAYPLFMLMWHEVVNDTVGGVPIVVTYCAPCNSGMVFERRVDDRAVSFRNTGLVHRGNRVLYDDETESWWQQFDGRALLGDRTGLVLETVAARHEAWSDFRSVHPDGMVFVPDDWHSKAYGTTAFPGYDTAAGMPYDGQYHGPGSPMIRVVAVAGLSEAWSFEHVRRHGVVRSGDIEISWQAGQASALDTERIDRGRDVGTVIVERRLTDGSREAVPYMVPFAFAYLRFYPDAKINHP